MRKFNRSCKLLNRLMEMGKREMAKREKRLRCKKRVKIRNKDKKRTERKKNKSNRVKLRSR